MKKLSILAIGAIVMMGVMFTSCDSKKSFSSANLKSEIDSVSYIVGKSYGIGFKKQGEQQGEQMMNSWPVKGNIDAFLAGLNSGWENEEDSLYLGKSMQEAVEYVNGILQDAATKAAETNKKEAENFLAENKGKSGVITVEDSGLQYQVITEGTGRKPTLDDWVRVLYTGTYIDGTEFDSSKLHGGQPTDFPLNGVIQGFSQGIQLMPIGSKYIFWIPVELGYGMSRPEIRPNSLLIFEVELLDIVPAPTQ